MRTNHKLVKKRSVVLQGRQELAALYLTINQYFEKKRKRAINNLCQLSLKSLQISLPAPF